MRRTTVVELVIIQPAHAHTDLSACDSPDQRLVEAIAVACLAHGIG
ncbi:hypothetical protein ACVWY5_006993 [Bradyrhizobium sp. USDA 3256]